MRYSRQTLLPELGPEGQSRLQSTRVLCIGAGGLGCAALPYLAAAGIGTIGICEDDKVELSNLQRQVLYKTDEVGQLKVALAAKALRELNPEVKIELHPTRLSAENALPLFAQYDIILDGSDNFPAKFLINDAALKTGKPWVYAAVLGFEAQIATFTSNGPCYRCLYANAPKNPVANCAEAGVLGAFVGMVGAMQAVEVVKLAARQPKLPPLFGRILTLDARHWQWRDYALHKNANCPICSKNSSEMRLIMTEACCTPASLPEITAEEAAQQKNVVFLDVREPHEWDEGHVPGATHIPLGTLLAQNAPELTHDKELIVYCRGGTRSKKALAYLQKLGFTNAKNLTGGFVAWERTNPARCERAA